MIRLLNLIVLALALPWLAPLPLVLVAGSLLVLIAWHDPALLAVAGQRLLRLRWFFLAIGILYLGFTPGIALIGPITYDGLIQGGSHVLVLAVLVSAVVVLLHGLPPPQLAASLLALLRPLSALGLPLERFAWRLAATLDAVADSERLVGNARDRRGITPAELVASTCIAVERAAQSSQAPLELPSVGHPGRWEWLAPIALALVLGGLIAVGE